MHAPPLPLARDLVLIGGGHTHALVLRRWGMDPLPGVRLTLINPGPTAPYSGMLPGHVAGHYDRDALDIDLVRLARFAGARLILGAADGIDLAAGTVSVPGRPPIGFDHLSLDIGITSDMPALPGFAEHAVPAKPLGPFATAWTGYLSADGPAEVAVIGAGVAGAELAMAMAHALDRAGRPATVTLIDAAIALSALRPPARARVLTALRRWNVALVENAAIARITAQGVTLADGRAIAAGFVTGAAGARPYPWLAQTGLDLHAGFVTVDDRLRASDPRVFAVGDCAHLAFDPRPKAGVYAVRQAPVLYDNLRGAAAGTGLRRYRPQRDYLKLVSLGGQSAMGDRLGLSFSGPWVWRWKDRIDRRFMHRFARLPAMHAPPLPWPRAQGLREAAGGQPLCGGCAAKVGPSVLSGVLDALPATARPDVVPLPGDDAGLLSMGATHQVISTDQLRAFIPDPGLMTRIAVEHALGDIWAMGAEPQGATLSLILPPQTDPLAARALAEITRTAAGTLAEAGAALVGGHSAIGAELTIGLTVTGLLDRPPITLAGARPGDALLLTRPLGTGVIMAAEMQGRAPGAAIAGALAQMARPQRAAALCLARAHAMTDVTGFGLAGHLRNICTASRTGARITLEAVPLLPGALDLARRGIRASLHPQNRAAQTGWPDGPLADLLLDPQTAGGLLAALPPDTADATLARLREAGETAARIGHLTDRPGQIEIV